jgi:hypothetical protein
VNARSRHLPAVVLSDAEYDEVIAVGVGRTAKAWGWVGLPSGRDRSWDFDAWSDLLDADHYWDLRSTVDDVAAELAVAKYLGCWWPDHEVDAAVGAAAPNGAPDVLVRRVGPRDLTNPSDSVPMVRSEDLGYGRVLVATSVMSEDPRVVLIWGSTRVDEQAASRSIAPGEAFPPFVVGLRELEHIDSLAGEPLGAVLRID